MIDICLKVRECAQRLKGCPFKPSKWIGKFGKGEWKSYTPLPAVTHPITAYISNFIIQTCHCCSPLFLPFKRWSLWAVFRKWCNVLSRMLKCGMSCRWSTHILSDVGGVLTRVSADIIVSTTQDKRLWRLLKYSLTRIDTAAPRFSLICLRQMREGNICTPVTASVINKVSLLECIKGGRSIRKLWK